MRRQPVSSSSIAAVGYDVERAVLEIRFHSGGTYRYSDVPRAVHEALVGAPSKGRYFAHAIRDRYPCDQVG